VICIDQGRADVEIILVDLDLGWMPFGGGAPSHLFLKSATPPLVNLRGTSVIATHRL
jgi:hypothetical protein